jgi:hypothetical protein
VHDTTNRRDFLDRLAVGTLAIGGLSTALAAVPARLEAAGLTSTPAAGPGAPHAQGSWDVQWPQKLTGQVRTVFDVPEVESGYGVWRASIWANQYQQVLGFPAKELSTALVLRHNAIILAMQQGYWDRYGVGAAAKVTHPLTTEATDRNPALLGAADGVPAPYANFALGPFMARGGVVLACDLALQDVVQNIQSREKVSPEEARAQALKWMVPGVILQPSGVFAVLRAQQEQALYIRAS